MANFLVTFPCHVQAEYLSKISFSEVQSHWLVSIFWPSNLEANFQSITAYQSFSHGKTGGRTRQVVGWGAGWERGKIHARNRSLEREEQRELKTSLSTSPPLPHWEKNNTVNLKGFPLSHLRLGEAFPSRTRSESLIFNISILSQEEKPSPWERELFPISLFQPVSSLNRETTLPSFCWKWSFARAPQDCSANKS